jgi:hypothetical protein
MPDPVCFSVKPSGMHIYIIILRKWCQRGIAYRHRWRVYNRPGKTNCKSSRRGVELREISEGQDRIFSIIKPILAIEIQ